MKRCYVSFFIFLLPAIGGESLEKEIQKMDRLLSARQIQEARTRGGGEEYLVYGLTLLGEQLLASGEIQRAQEILLPQTGHREGSLALGLLQLLVMRLKESKEGGDRSLLTTPPGDHQEIIYI